MKFNWKKTLRIAGVVGIVWQLIVVAENEDGNFHFLLKEISTLKTVLDVEDNIYVLRLSSEPLRWISESYDGGKPVQVPKEPSHNAIDPIIEIFRGPKANGECWDAETNLVKDVRRVGYCVEVKNGSHY